MKSLNVCSLFDKLIFIVTFKLFDLNRDGVITKVFFEMT